jgi:regulator of cell morphogenesis and NO signaling
MMDLITRDDSVRDIVLRDFRAAMVFHRHGINFCCGGNVPLWSACRDRQVPEDEVLDDLARACGEPDPVTPRFAEWEPETLIAYIVGAHHAYLRAALPAVAAHTQRLAASHGERQPELREVADLVETLVAELTSHMAKEENILFPYIVATADAVRRGRPRPVAPFGRIDSPLRILEAEHEVAGAAMDRIRTLTDGFTPPADACTTHRVCLQELDALQRDLRTHVHLENNLLFPRARRLASPADGAPIIGATEPAAHDLPCRDTKPSEGC